MMDALEKVEKELKKPLMRNDKKGMALLMAEFDKVNKKYVLFHKLNVLHVLDLIRLSHLILTLLCMHLIMMTSFASVCGLNRIDFVIFGFPLEGCWLLIY